MDTIPIEITSIIINYNPDMTLIASMVCTYWHHIIHNKCVKLTDNFAINTKFDFSKTIFETNSYVLSKYYKKNETHITMRTINIYNVSDHNCLKIMTYIMSNNIISTNKDQIIIISKKLCETNNIVIKKFLSRSLIRSDALDILLKICLENGSYDVANYLIVTGATCTEWISSVIKCNYHTPHCREFIKPLQYLTFMRAINLPLFHSKMLCHSDKYLCRILASRAKKYRNALPYGIFDMYMCNKFPACSWTNDSASG